ncbi:unnamed protein product [Timema podura]|uniref:Uncharacterized protein n=1 Tax=Timema podura TaxID=61482 RepID=A0ABN7NWI6_TIMPD|nr:unnamed protein product [Timema podura]
MQGRLVTFKVNKVYTILIGAVSYAEQVATYGDYTESVLHPKCRWVDRHRAQPQHHDSDAALWKFSSSSSSLGSSPYMSANLRNRGPKLDRSSKFRSFSSVPASGDTRLRYLTTIY